MHDHPGPIEARKHKSEFLITKNLLTSKRRARLSAKLDVATHRFHSHLISRTANRQSSFGYGQIPIWIARRMSSKNKVVKIAKIDILLAIMACMSVVVLAIPRDWLAYSYQVDPINYDAGLSDDTYSNGDSHAQWVDRDQQIWKCTIGTVFINPYCSMQIRVTGHAGAGLDLSRFSKLKIWLSYQGDARYIRVYLRNRDPKYFSAIDETTTKYNIVELPVDGLDNGLEINMQDFKVADWWLVHRNVKLQDSHPQFNDVIYIEVQTGSQVRHGEHVIQLKKLEFTGSLITEQSLYKAMVILWILLIFGVLIFRFVKLKWELNAHKNYQNELVSINRLLNLQNKRFEDLAKTDQLTGLLNRIGMREPLYHGLKCWQESRTPFAFVLIDIDHFKKVNDVYGHDVGDQILKGVADLLSENVRKTDSVARWGGEEFILVCPGTNLEQAHNVAEHLRAKLEKASLHPQIPVTASFGVAAMTQPDLDHLFKSADEALYEAKGLGRNCVVAKH